MQILRSIDIEDVIREALSSYVTIYCRPLPEHYSLPCILVQQVGGRDESTIDTFEVVLDSRASNEAEASEYLRNAVGILREVARLQSSEIRNVTVNSSGSWGNDPVRPDLAMCSARIRVIAHLENVEVNTHGNT